MKNMPFEKVLIRALKNILGGPALNSQQGRGGGGLLHGLTHDLVKFLFNYWRSAETKKKQFFLWPKMADHN